MLMQFALVIGNIELFTGCFLVNFYIVELYSG